MEKTYRNKLPNDVVVNNTLVQIENGELIVTVTFDKPFMPKDGDFLVGAMGNVFIYSDKDAVDKDICSSYCGIYAGDNNGSISTIFSNNWTYREGCRYATPTEKSAFLERLEREYHKSWNPEKKCLEDIYVPKFGDIVKVILDDINNNSYKRNYMICIYPNKNFSETNRFFNPPFLSLNGRLILNDTGGSKYCNSIILASESEKQELFDKLAEVGKRWNPETKQLEDIRWRAKKREEYYTINGALDVVGEFAGACPYEDVLHERGNYFRTPEAAQKVADQIKELFKNSKAE